MWLGFALLRLSNWSDARAAFRSAARFAPYEVIAINAKAAVAIVDGEECLAKGDLEGALINFDKGVDINPEDANTRLARGRARMSKRDAQGALIDYSKAVELKPSFAPAYASRGAAELALNELDAAKIDLDKAITMAPDSPEPRFNRGLLCLRRDDLDGARTNLNQAAALSPEALAMAAPYFAKLSILRCQRHDFREALIDARRADEAGFQSDYTALIIWLIRSRLGEDKSATHELLTHLDKRRGADSDSWPMKIGRFLTGQLTEMDLFKAAENDDQEKWSAQQCEAHFYVGTKRLVEGDTATAVGHFEKCVATGRKEFSEYQMAVTELQRLKAGI
jgi:lipoprotein NlpI